MEYQWVIKPTPLPKTIRLLMEEVNLPRPLAVILAQRGIDSFESAKEYFRPSLERLYDPYMMKGMEKAVQRIINAIERKEKILIYGDYDVDGTTSVALMYDFLISVYPNISYYIPDRYNEGYGISIDGIDYAADNSFSLVIALDCGIKAIDKIDYANEKGIDFIICDHHLPGDSLPAAYAILDPKQPDCNYPFKDLSGCGVGFKLIQALAPKLGIEDEKLFSYLDLLVVSIAADIVSITDENRIFSHFGLNQLRKHSRPGLKVLLGSTENVDISDIVFNLAPKINATGRLRHASQSVELLISKEQDTVKEIADQITKLNAERKVKDGHVTSEAIRLIKENNEIDRFSTVVYSPNWHKGVLGIVASRLIDTYYRPTLVLTEGNEGEISGSARSVKGFDIYEVIEACSDLLSRYGGHKFAAGLSMPAENYELFKERFEALVKEKIRPAQRIPTVEIDTPIGFDEITTSFLRIHDQMFPFGPDNMTPVFLTTQLIGGNVRKIGKSGEHLKMEVMDANNIKFSATAFGMGEMEEDFRYRKFDLVYSIRKNYWNGNCYRQFNIQAVRFEE